MRISKAQKRQNLIDAITAEINATTRTRDAANDAMDEARFYEACARIRRLQEELHEAHKGPFKGCENTLALVLANCD